MFARFRGSFVIGSRSIREPALQKTVDSIRKQDLVEWECVLFLEETPHEWELFEISHHSPRFRIGTTDEWNPWSDLRSDLAIHVFAGTELTPGAFASLVAVDYTYVSLVYGNTTECVRPDWSPMRYRNDHYFGDVIAFKRESGPDHKIKRIRNVLSKGGRGSFPPVPRAISQSIADCAKGSSLHSVNVVIPTAGTASKHTGSTTPMVLDLVESIGTPDDVTLTVVADSHCPDEVRSALIKLPHVHLETYEKTFNFSEKCNVGALSIKSDIVFFLNDDMLCLDSSWPSEIRKTLSVKKVGAVGGLMLTTEGLVQCAGHGNTPVPHLYGVGLDPQDPANHSVLSVEREVSGLSGACVAMRREDYLDIGGMTELLAEGYNDVDLGFKVLSSGKSLIFNPAIRFVHFESATRDPKVNPAEWEFVSNRWGRYFGNDPYTP